MREIQAPRGVRRYTCLKTIKIREKTGEYICGLGIFLQSSKIQEPMSKRIGRFGNFQTKISAQPKTAHASCLPGLRLFGEQVWDSFSQLPSRHPPRTALERTPPSTGDHGPTCKQPGTHRVTQAQLPQRRRDNVSGQVAGGSRTALATAAVTY